MTSDIISQAGITEVQGDPENTQGMVGRIDRAKLAGARASLRDAGYNVSDSRDEAGVTWIWWMPADLQIKATQTFNGEVAGHGETIHDIGAAVRAVSSPAGLADGVASLLRRYEGAGAGWGVELAVATEATARALGAYPSDVPGHWWIPLADRDPVSLTVDALVRS